MQNMAMTKKEAKEEYGSPTADSELPKYPYGLRLYLDDETLTKLGITTLPIVSSTMLLQAQVTVVSVGSSQSQGDDAESTVNLQITDMELSAAGKSPEQRASMLYKK